MTLRVRTASGWQSALADGVPIACPAADATGGTLCPLAQAWWSGPGRILCASASAKCEGSAGELVTSAPISPPVVAADLDSTSVWVLRPHTLERIGLGETLAFSLKAQQPLAKKARDVATRGAVALVATDDGVQMATGTENGFSLGPVLELCGRPIDVEPLGDDAWAVATTLGVALVGGGVEEPLRILSMSVLVPAGVNGKILPLAVDALGIGGCKLADKSPGLADLAAGVTALAPSGGARLLVASGLALFDLDTRDTGAPVLRAWLNLAKPLHALRVDVAGGRAYGVGDPGDRPTFDLRGDPIAELGEHDVSAWVERREAGGVLLRVGSSHADVAKVVP